MKNLWLSLNQALEKLKYHGKLEMKIWINLEFGFIIHGSSHIKNIKYKLWHCRSSVDAEQGANVHRRMPFIRWATVGGPLPILLGVTPKQIDN